MSNLSDAMQAQQHGTTGVYVDNVRTETFLGNTLEAERIVIEAQRAAGLRYVERVVFGHGRVALVFSTPAPVAPGPFPHALARQVMEKGPDYRGV